MRIVLLAFVVMLSSACGSLGPGRDAGATGGGGGFFFPTGGGGGTSTGGGFVSTGGGAATGGGGGGATGGGSATGGGLATGGGVAATGGGTAVDAGPPPMTWASMGIMNNTSSDALIGISGELNDVWAVADYSGGVFHSTGAAFNRVLTLSGTSKGIYARGGTVVVVQQQNIQTCTTGCETVANYSAVALNQTNFGAALTGKAICGKSPTDITVIAEKNDYDAVILKWNGTVWITENSNTALSTPTACWFDDAGRLMVVADEGVGVFEGGAGTPVVLSTNSQLTYLGGGTVNGTSFVVGNYSFVAKGTNVTWAPIPIPQTVSDQSFLRAVGGLRDDEVFLLGYHTSTNGPGLLWNGTTLKKIGTGVIPSFTDQTTVRAILKTSPTELLLAGGSSSGPIVVRGRR